MRIQARVPVVIAGALAATTIAGVAAFATPATGMASVGMGGHPSHMAELDDASFAEMAAMMGGADSVGEMHGQMHPEMGGDLGSMHRTMAPRSS